MPHRTLAPNSGRWTPYCQPGDRPTHGGPEHVLRDERVEVQGETLLRDQSGPRELPIAGGTTIPPASQGTRNQHDPSAEPGG